MLKATFNFKTKKSSKENNNNQINVLDPVTEVAPASLSSSGCGTSSSCSSLEEGVVVTGGEGSSGSLSPPSPSSSPSSSSALNASTTAGYCGVSSGSQSKNKELCSSSPVAPVGGDKVKGGSSNNNKKSSLLFSPFSSLSSSLSSSNKNPPSSSNTMMSCTSGLSTPSSSSTSTCNKHHNINNSLSSASSASSSACMDGPYKIVVAMHDFDPVNPDTDLPLNRTEEYEVLSESIEGCAGWWKVRNRYGEVGLIPSNYVNEKVPRKTKPSSSLTSASLVINSSSASSSSTPSSSLHHHQNSTASSSSTSSFGSTGCGGGSTPARPPVAVMERIVGGGVTPSSTKSHHHKSHPTSKSSSSLSSSHNHHHSSSNHHHHHQQSSLAQCHWFLPDLDRESAERLVKVDGREGCFLVRYSKSQELYTISLLIKRHAHYDDIKHYLIRKSSPDAGHPPSYYLSENSLHFKSIEELIYFHRREAGCLAMRLKHPPSLIHASPSKGGSKGSSEEDIRLSRVALSKLYGDKSWEIRVQELSLLEELGSGQFGVVRRGRWTKTIDDRESGRRKNVCCDVAVKLMKEGTMSEADFVREAKVMTKLKHPNLVQLYGICIEHRPICIVTEFMKYGSLLSFLRSRASQLRQAPGQLLQICLQVCEGMAYLEAKNYIHRDLAARNCLVGEGHVVKVADFGLTRFVADSNEYTSSSGTKFPIKWAPPEVLWFTKFSSKSDVWAFGVLMWEVFTCGQMPYGRSSNAQVVEMIRNGERLEKPRLCSTEIFQVMEDCWDELPEKRPSFLQLNQRLKHLLLG